MRFLRLIFLHMLALLAWPFARRAPAEVRRVLYIKPDHLGDMLLATPVLAALRQRFPEARITALVGPWARMALERNPNVDVLATCPFPGFERTKDERRTTKAAQFWLSSFVVRLWSLLTPYVLLLRYAALLRATRYDLAIIGRDDHWWGAALALLAGVPQRVGYAVPECRPFLSNALPWNPNEHVTRQGLALVDRSNAGTLERWSVEASNAAPLRPALFVPAPADVAWAEEWHAAHLAPGEKLVIIHPGTGGAAKHWLDERWSEVADRLLKEPKTRGVLTGGPGEEARVARIRANMLRGALNLAGQTSVGQLAALMARAALVMGVDSGPLHLAAAVGARTIHLYGPGDERRFGPWGDPATHTVVHTELWCRPCGVFSACPRGLAIPECMERISVGTLERLSVEAIQD